MSIGALTGMIKHSYKNKLLTVGRVIWRQCLDQTLGPEDEKVRSPKIVRSLCS